MGIFDVIILITMAFMAYRWARLGLVQGVFSLLGLLLGIVGGALLAPWILRLFSDPLLKLAAILLVVMSLSAVFAVVFERVGSYVQSKRDQHRLRRLDSVLGAAFSVVLTAIYVWLFAAILSGSPFVNLNRTFEDSQIVQSINRSFPPAPAVLARIGGSLSQLSFPQVFVGPAPIPAAPVAGAGGAEVNQALAAAGKSVVRIRAFGCGGVSSGSGFVAGEGLVVTNAHVVAGSSNLIVEDAAGRHRAVAVYFDPDLDLAVVRTSGLAGTPLPIASATFPRGTPAVAMGYPGGGQFAAAPAAILRQLNARGLNIYGQRNVTRQIYELQARVIEGDSGGPVVRADGTVIGVIFARSESGQPVGYALTSASIQAAVRQAARTGGQALTGQCVAD